MHSFIFCSDISTDQITFRFLYYYWINGQMLVGSELDNARYPEVKPVDYEGYMSKWWPRGQLALSFSLAM